MNGMEAHVAVLIHGTSERNSRFLPSGEIDSLFSDFGHVPRGETRDIGEQRARLQNFLLLIRSDWPHFVFFFIERRAEKNIIAKRCVHNERRLRHIADASFDVNHRIQVGRLVEPRHFAQNRVQQRGLSTAHVADNRRELIGLEGHIDSGQFERLA